MSQSGGGVPADGWMDGCKNLFVTRVQSCLFLKSFCSFQRENVTIVTTHCETSPKKPFTFIRLQEFISKMSSTLKWLALSW